MINSTLALLISSIAMIFFGYFAFLARTDYFSVIPMLLLALPTYSDLIRTNFKKGILIIIVLSVYAAMIEALSILTSFPYGSFVYNKQLGYKLFDVVPWTVGFGWAPLVIGCFTLGIWQFKNRYNQFIFGVLFLVSADLVLDPGAVLMRFWTWENPGIYYGIPFSNYLGWLLSSVIGGFLYYYIFTKTEILKLSKLSVLTLALGNAFWIGVTYSNSYWIPCLVGCLMQILIIWTTHIKSKQKV
ncbi:MAG: carotenoid biosynthesis protein [Bacteroidetes bacterium]|nr:carotenoid biosynthesis protein [Bacteroidota bacterium]MDA0861061.1 carotenoid biosynthesis protein [Bacteroidota bacterium]MDA1319288.1 carotenoid biosynthesis protein [Bacteroidota bacterium]